MATDQVHNVIGLVWIAEDVRLLVLNTSSKLIFDVFWQLLVLTSGTSCGSANVMSTHCEINHIGQYKTLKIQGAALSMQIGSILSNTQKMIVKERVFKRKLTLYNAAPCCAASITWIVALFPTFAV